MTIGQIPCSLFSFCSVCMAVGAFFDKNKILTNEDGSKTPNKLKFVYIGKGQDQDLIGLNLKGKIAVMDRIYTKDLKNAFKRATDKGARAIMVVNTVNYYNRDNWTELPAMGYEEFYHSTRNFYQYLLSLLF